MTQSKNTKRALLISLLSVVLCLTMLIGTTFAWFTDSASASVSSIQAGNLKISLLDTDGNDLTGQTLAWQKAEGASEGEAILWEPGCTYELQPVIIQNNGNLALKYKIKIAGITGDNDLKDAIVWTIKVGSEEIDLDTYQGYLAAGESETEPLTISGHMKETAGSEYQGKSIEGVSITVVATQDTVEFDSSRNDYDATAAYPVIVDDTKKLTTAITSAKNGDVIVLAGDMDVNGLKNEDGTNVYDVNNRLVLGADNVTIDLNGNDLTIYNHTLTITGDNITIKNGTLIATPTNDKQTYGSYVVAVGGKNVTLENLTTIGGISVNGYSEYADEVDVTHSGANAIITNCNITNTNYYAVCTQGEASAYVSNCTLNCVTGKYTFWIEKAYTDEYGSVGNSSLTYESDTVTIIGDLALYNPGGLAPIEN